MDRILQWVHLDMDERELRNRVKNKMIRPTTIPQSLEALVFEQAVAREALRLAYQQAVHKGGSAVPVVLMLSDGQATVGESRANVLAAQGDTIEVLHTLRPLIVVMAGADVFDPYKD